MHRAGARISDSSFPPADRIRATSPPNLSNSRPYRKSPPVLKLRLTVLQISARLIRLIIEFIVARNEGIEKKGVCFYYQGNFIINNFCISYVTTLRIETGSSVFL